MNLLFVLLKLTWPHLIIHTSRLASLKNVQQWIITDIQKDTVKVFTDLLRSYALWQNTTPLSSAPSNSVTGSDVTWCFYAAWLFAITCVHAGVIQLISTTALTSVFVLRFAYSVYTKWIKWIHNNFKVISPVVFLLTLNILSLAHQRCLPGWGPRRTPWFFFFVISQLFDAVDYSNYVFFGFLKL